MSMSNTEKTVQDILEKPAVNSPPRRKLALSWMACVVKARSLNSVARKASTPTSTIAGARISWGLAKSVCLVIMFGCFPSFGAVVL